MSAEGPVRQAHLSPCQGRQYLHRIAFTEEGLELFDFCGAGYDAAGRRLGGQIVAWSCVLDDEEVLCLFNSHGGKSRSADVLVDAVLNRTDSKGALNVVFNSTQETKRPGRYAGADCRGSKQTVKRRDEMAYVMIRDLAPSQVLVAGIAHGEGGGDGGVEGIEGGLELSFR
jgi:hypothetical protein